MNNEKRKRRRDRVTGRQIFSPSHLFSVPPSLRLSVSPSLCPSVYFSSVSLLSAQVERKSHFRDARGADRHCLFSLRQLLQECLPDFGIGLGGIVALRVRQSQIILARRQSLDYELSRGVDLRTEISGLIAADLLHIGMNHNIGRRRAPDDFQLPLNRRDAVREHDPKIMRLFPRAYFDLTPLRDAAALDSEDGKFIR